MKDMNNWVWAILLIPIILLAIGGLALKNEIDQSQNAKTQGIVIETFSKRNNISTKTKGPATSPVAKIEFTDHLGALHQFETSGSGLDEGDKVSVLFDKNNPKKAEVDRYTRWIFPGAFLFMGCCILFTFVVSLFKYRR